jgi:chaperonin cofactor prefoldin
MDNRNFTRKFLLEATVRVDEREEEIEFASNSLDHQMEHLNELLEEAESDDEDKVIRGFN